MNKKETSYVQKEFAKGSAAVLKYRGIAQELLQAIKTIIKAEELLK